MRNFKLGADPEMFLFDKNDKPISAIDKIPGTKEKPFKISDKGHSVQVDNVLLEFNVPPSDNFNDMYENIQFVLKWFSKNLKDGSKYKIITSVEMPEDQLDNPKANEFFCDPDFDVWTGKTNGSPDATKTHWRSAGGHIHVSYDDANMETSAKLIKAMDLFLGVPSILYDNDDKRRSLYGKAGAFRFKNYPNGESGVEYRTLSNFWIKDKETVKWVYNQVKKAIDFIDNNPEIPDNSKLAKNIVSCINTSDITLAENLIKRYKIQ